MKALKIQIQKSSRWLVILLATVVAIITSVVVANATQTITTPNAVKIAYNLAAGASSAAITPVLNTSVLVMGCCTSDTARGVGQVSLLRSPLNSSSNLGFIEWTGLESPFPAAITSGSTGSPGDHIVFIDNPHTVEILTGATANSLAIIVHNADIVTRAGSVTLIW